MGNLNLTELSSKEKALRIFGYLFEDAEVKIKKLKDSAVLESLWDLATNKDDSKLKKAIKTRASELGITLVG